MNNISYNKISIFIFITGVILYMFSIVNIIMSINIYMVNKEKLNKENLSDEYVQEYKTPIILICMYSNKNNEEVKCIEEIEEIDVNEVEVNYPTIPINKVIGKVKGPQEIETYYNLPMDNVIQKMRNMGYVEEDYPYYIRDDGVKMLGDFIIVAADLNEYPIGTIVQTSLGQAIVCDCCETLDTIDLAVDW